MDKALAEAIECQQQGKIKSAIGLYRRILEVQPDNLTALINLGAGLRQQKNPVPAEEYFRRAIEIDSGNPGIHFNLGNSLADQGKFENAIACYRKAIAIDPNFVSAHNNHGNVLSQLNRFDDAITSFTRSLRIEPENAEAMNNLGNALKRQGQLADAVTWLTKASDIEPRNPEIQNNLGNALRDTGRLEEAVTCYKAAIAIDPNHADSHCLYAFSLLALGAFTRGWEEYEWRWKSDEHEAARIFPFPPWDGSDLDGKTILIWGEQGIGDEIMFASMLPELISAASHVILECEHRLVPLFRRSFRTLSVFPRKDPPVSGLMSATADWQIPLGSLGRVLRPNLAAFSKRLSFLQPDAGTVAATRDRYAKLTSGRRAIGIAWRSGNVETGAQRSIRLEDWLPILNDNNSIFVNLQYGDVSDEIAELESQHGIRVYQDAHVNQINNIDLFAAQIAALDLVISVANTTVHVAGALGAEVWVLLPLASDWRWLTQRSDSLWYGAVRLHRQTELGNWNELLTGVGKALRVRPNPIP